MKKLFVLTVMVTVSVCLPASAAIIYVPGQYSTIQEGINASSNGDTVLVQPGTYYENINFNGHNILLCSMFLPTNDTTYTSSTIIDGSNSSSTVKFAGGEDSTAIICGFTIQHGYNDYGGGIRCIVSSPAIKNNIIRRNRSFGGGGIYCDRSNPLIVNNVIYEDTANYGGGIFCYDSSSPLIDNNTIKYNYSDGLNYGSGAGICCMTNSHPTISNNTIIFNTIYCSYGGGISCYDNSNADINNNVITGNSSSEAGGISCQHSSPTIRNNIISGNSALGGAGGISCVNANPKIKNNTINNNIGYIGGIYCINSNSEILFNLIIENSGSGIQCLGSNPTIYHNTIIENDRSGIYCQVSNPEIINNIITKNSADMGGGICCIEVSNPKIMNTICWGDSAIIGSEIWADTSSSPVITYCNIQDTLWPGVGNISIDPLFKNLDDNDYHLMSTLCGDLYDSPCIDTGNPYIADSLLDCSWGLGGIRSDMGAYGGADSTMVGVPEHQLEMPTIYDLSQNYPNPFNSTTIIQFSLPSNSDVRFEVYNIMGRKIATLLNGHKTAGRYQVDWDAANCASGIYFYRLTAGEYTAVRKMSLIK